MVSMNFVKSVCAVNGKLKGKSRRKCPEVSIQLYRYFCARRVDAGIRRGESVIRSSALAGDRSSSTVYPWFLGIKEHSFGTYSIRGRTTGSPLRCAATALHFKRNINDDLHEIHHVYKVHNVHNVHEKRKSGMVGHARLHFYIVCCLLLPFALTSALIPLRFVINSMMRGKRDTGLWGRRK